MAIQKLEETLDADYYSEECLWVSFKVWVCVIIFFLFRRILVIVGSYIRINSQVSQLDSDTVNVKRERETHSSD
jgi:hypothetical protein